MKKMLAVLFLLFPTLVFAQNQPDYDLAMKSRDLRLSKEATNLIAGETVRVYAQVINNGNNDSTGVVAFFMGGAVLGSAPVSLPASGVQDEVFIDFTVPVNSFNILAKVVEIEPRDDILTNNESLSQMFEPQSDNDGDGAGDVIDTDDDNDGVPDRTELENGTNPLLSDTDADGSGDSTEIQEGTDPLNADSDGDGVPDGSDTFPLDSKKSQPEPTPSPKPPTEPVSVNPHPVIRDDSVKASADSAKPQEPNSTDPGIVEQSENFFGPFIDKANAEELVAVAAQNAEKRHDFQTDAFYRSPEIEMLKSVEISVKQINWNTFDFSFSSNLDDAGSHLSFIWDFGDGTVSDKNGSHTFYRPGDKFATLKVKGGLGNYLYAVKKVRVEFFSVYNYWLWLLISVIIIMVSLSVRLSGIIPVAKKIYRSKAEEKQK